MLSISFFILVIDKQYGKYIFSGKGLGREENGIKTFIKPKLKSSLSGVGHNEADEHSFHWWDHIYNKAANNISVKKKKVRVKDVLGSGPNTVQLEPTRAFS